MSGAGYSLTGLPAESLLHIFRHLHFKDLTRLSCLSRRLRQLTSDDSLWKWQCHFYFLDDSCDHNVTWQQRFIQLFSQFGQYPDYLEVRQAWNQIEKYLKNHCSTLLTALNGPAEEEDISQLEQQLGYKLPLDFRVSLRIHNGQDFEASGLMGTSMIATHKRSDILLDLVQILECMYELKGVSEDENHYTGCLPLTFCVNTSSLTLLALSGDGGYTKGHVYLPSGYDDDGKCGRSCFEAADSFKSWLCAYAKGLEDERYSTNGQEILKFYKDPDCVAISYGIKVTVGTCFQPELTTGSIQPDDFKFTYRITLDMSKKADPDHSCQLETRHWEIIDMHGYSQLVDGPGVVGHLIAGEFPTMQPGTTFTWISCCALPTTSGSMKGHFSMRNLKTGGVMLVECPSFYMEAPPFLNYVELTRRQNLLQQDMRLLQQEDAIPVGAGDGPEASA